MRATIWTIGLAVIGGLVGSLVFDWLATQGFYGLVLPGGLAGMGAGLVHRRASAAMAGLCAVIALAAGVLTEFRFAPFAVDPSLGYFLGHLFDLRPLTLILIALGGGIGFYGPYRPRSRKSHDSLTPSV